MSEKPKWDIGKMEGWKAEQFPRGAVIPEGATSRGYVTGGWRSQRPVRDIEKCTQCLQCWIFCPDSAIRTEDQRIVGFDLEHCKGCGICAAECPPKCIEMVPEGSEVKGE